MKILTMTRPHQENGIYYLTSPILPIVDEDNRPCIYKLMLGPDECKLPVYHCHPNNLDVLRGYIFRVIKQNDILFINWKDTPMYKEPGFFHILGFYGDWKTNIDAEPPDPNRNWNIDDHGNFLSNSDKTPPANDV